MEKTNKQTNKVTNIKQTEKMKTKDVNTKAKETAQKIVKETAQIKQGSINEKNSNDTNKDKDLVANTVEKEEEKANQRPNGVQRKSAFSKQAKKDHNSIANVCRTIKEITSKTEEYKDYVKERKRIFSPSGNKQVSYDVKVEHFSYETVTSILPYIKTKDGTHIYCRQVKHTEDSKFNPAETYGEYKDKNNKVYKVDGLQTVLFRETDSKGVESDYTLRPIKEFTPWGIITAVERVLKEEAKEGLLVIREERQKMLQKAKELKLYYRKTKDYIEANNINTLEEFEENVINNKDVLNDLLNTTTQRRKKKK